MLAEQQFPLLSQHLFHRIVFTVCYIRSRTSLSCFIPVITENFSLLRSAVIFSILVLASDQYSVRSFLFCLQTDNVSNLSEVIVVAFLYRVSVIQSTFLYCLLQFNEFSLFSHVLFFMNSDLFFFTVYFSFPQSYSFSPDIFHNSLECPKGLGTFPCLCFASTLLAKEKKGENLCWNNAKSNPFNQNHVLMQRLLVSHIHILSK